jgi:hypothetical protein
MFRMALALFLVLTTHSIGRPGDLTTVTKGTILTQTPARAASLLGILGVEGQVAGNVAVYLDATGVAADTAFIGARHFRESLAATEPWHITVLQALVKEGVSLIAFPPTRGSSTPVTYVISDLIAAAQTFAQLGPTALFALEGPNEPVNFPINYLGKTGGGTGSFVPVANFQRDFYAAVKANSTLAHIPVYTATLGGAETDDAGLQYAKIPASAGTLMPDGTIFADVLNQHVYTVFAGTVQSVSLRHGNQFTANLEANFVNTWVNRYSGYTLAQAQALPRAITEYGLHTAPGTDGPSVDIGVWGKNLMTGLLNAWADGYLLLSIYELYDEGDGFGVFSSTGKPRTSAIYLHNFTTILNDTAANAATFTTTPLPITVRNLPSTAKCQVFQKSSGAYFIVLWDRVDNYNLSAQTAIAVPATAVTLDVDNAGAFSIFDPTLGISGVFSATGTSVTVSLTDYPIIVKLVTN